MCAGEQMIKDNQGVAQAQPCAGRRKSSIVPGSKLADFEVQTELGRGTYGVVSKVKSKLDGQVYVLKKVRCASLPAHRQKQVMMEVSLLRRLNHPHIIGYYNSFTEKNSLYIVMEYAPNGDLQRVLDQHKRNKSYIPEKTLLKLLFELTQALQHLHAKNIIHRDIKMVNVLLDEESKVKLGDLGVSRTIEGDDDMAQSRVGTPLYLAPELIKRQPYDFKADIWALGVLMYNMSSLKGPFTGQNIYALGYSIIHDTPAPLPGMYSKGLSALILSMLDKAAGRRPSVHEILDKLVAMSPQLVNGGAQRAWHDSEADNASMQTTAGAAGNDSLCAPHPAPPAADDPLSLHFPSRVATRQVSRPVSAHSRIEMRRLPLDKAPPGADGSSHSDRRGAVSARADSGMGYGAGVPLEAIRRAVEGGGGQSKVEAEESESVVLDEAECSLTARTPREIVVKQYSNPKLLGAGAGKAGAVRAGTSPQQEVERVSSSRSLFRAPDASDDARSSGWHGAGASRRPTTRPVSAPQQRTLQAAWHHGALDRDMLHEYRRPSSRMLLGPRGDDVGAARGVLEAVKESGSPLAAARPPLSDSAGRPQTPRVRPASAGARTSATTGCLRNAEAGSGGRGASYGERSVTAIQVKQPVLSRAVMAQHHNARAQAETKHARPASAPRVVVVEAAQRGSSSRPAQHSSSSATRSPPPQIRANNTTTASVATPPTPTAAPATHSGTGKQNASNAAFAQDEKGQSHRPTSVAQEGSAGEKRRDAGDDGRVEYHSRSRPKDDVRPVAASEKGGTQAPVSGPARVWEGMGVDQPRGMRVPSKARPVSAQARLSTVVDVEGWAQPALLVGRQTSAALAVRVGGNRPSTASVHGRRRPTIADLK